MKKLNDLLTEALRNVEAAMREARNLAKRGKLEEPETLKTLGIARKHILHVAGGIF
jgi:hypothetical protein